MNKFPKVVALGFIAALLVSFVPPTQAAVQNVRYTWVNSTPYTCDSGPAATSGTLEWTASITNNGPGSLYIEKAAFHSPIAGCAATSENVDGTLLTMTGKTQYADGETGTVSFSYNLNSFNCGRVQVDAAYRNSDGSYDGHVFLGEVIDYGVNCTATPPPPPVNHLPGGVLDAANCEIIGGWAFDPDTDWAEIAIHIYDGGAGNGLPIPTTTTGLRADVNAAYGISGNHGFTITTPASLKDGNTHSIYAYAIDSTGGTNFELIGSPKSLNCPGATPPPVNHIPTGVLDAANCEIIGGWAFDPNTPSSQLAIHLYDGGAGNGLPIATETTGLRPDINDQYGITGNHGFTIFTPAAFKDGNPHSIYAYAIDSTGGTNFELIGSPKTIVCGTTPTPPPPPPVNQLPIGVLDAVNCEIIGGWAFDPNNPTSQIAIHLYDGGAGNGLPIATETTGLRPDVNDQYGITGNHGFTIFTPASLKDGNSHSIYAYAIDSTGGTNFELIGSPKSLNCPGPVTPPPPPVNHLPTGVLDAANCDIIGGWAYDPDQPTSQITVHLYVDAPTNDSPIGTETTGLRPDVNASLGITGNHGFTIFTPASLKDGNTHTIYAYAIDSAGGPNFHLIGSPKSFTCTTTPPPPPAAGVISLTKNVRNVTQGQTTFLPSVGANPGDQVEFQIVVSSNSGNVNNVVLSDQLPTNLNYVSNSLTVDGVPNNSNLNSINLGNFSGNQVRQINFIANVSQASQFVIGTTTLTNTAQITSNSNSTSAQARVLVTRNPVTVDTNVFLNITKEVRNLTRGSGYASSVNAQLNDRLEYRIIVRNIGNNPANNVRISDILPFGIVYTQGTAQLDNGFLSNNIFNSSENLGTINASQTRTIVYQATVNQNVTGSLNNRAQVSADNVPAQIANASVFVSGTSVNPGSTINLVLSKRAFNQTKNVDATTVAASPNDLIVYTLVVQNTGNASATNYEFRDDLSDILKLSRLDAFGDGKFHSSELILSWNSMTIPANSTVEKTFSVRVHSTFPAGTDRVMTNTFGNTVNVSVSAGVVGGVFVSPKTGATTFWAVTLSILAVLAFATIRNRDLLQTKFRRIIA